MSNFSPDETDWHQLASFTFLPWVGRMLGHGPLQGESKPLPVGTPHALTSESLEGIDQIARRAVWQYLARDCGWVRLTTPSINRPHRIWEAEAPLITFSDWSLTILLQVFNSTRAQNNFNASLFACGGSTNGDLLIHHLIFRRLVESSPLLGAARNYPFEFWYDNPLNRGFHFLNCQRRPAREVWAMLEECDLISFLPWILHEWSRAWQRSFRLRWDQDPSPWHRAHTQICEELIELADSLQRPDLLSALLAFFHQSAQRADADLASFEAWSLGRPHAERNERTEPWAHHIAIAECLQSVYQGLTALHPVERLQPQKLLMALYQNLEFDQSVSRLLALRDVIRPAIF